jgi:hypothetical protein
MLHMKSQMTFRAVWTLQKVGKVGLRGPKLGIHGRTVLGMMMMLDSSGPQKVVLDSSGPQEVWTGVNTGNGATTQEV